MTRPRPFRITLSMESLAAALYTNRTEATQPHETWEKQSEEVKNGYLLEARAVLNKLVASIPAAEQLPIDAIRTAFEVGFTTGVLYASPSHSSWPQSFMDMVHSEARKQARNYMEQVHHA
jgi:hypothetical protein